MPAPDRELDAGGGTNTAQTARILGALEPVLADLSPSLVLVYGDTNSTLAGALAASQAGIPTAHVEAGMRSFDRSMPEELNRVLTDHASELLLCSTETAILNLEREGVRGESHLVGDVMADVSLAFRDIAEERSDDRSTSIGLEAGSYLVVTAHRAGNVDDPSASSALVALLEALPAPVVLPLHPRTRERLTAAGLMDRLDADTGRAAARLPGLHEARPSRARGAHRLRRGPEGGVPPRRAVRDAPRHHGMGRDGGGGLEHARGPRSRRGACGAGAPTARATDPSCTAAGTPPSAFARCSPPTLSAYEDRNSWPWLRRPSACDRVLRGGPRRGRRGHGRRAWPMRSRAADSHVEDVLDEALAAIAERLQRRPRATRTSPRSTRSSSPFRPRSRATASPTSSR